MRIDIICVVPELLNSPFEASILKRAIDAKLVEVYVHDLESSFRVPHSKLIGIKKISLLPRANNRVIDLIIGNWI